jgi:branched-subunit amino acid ABC-type transport system permease component
VALVLRSLVAAVFGGSALHLDAEMRRLRLPGVFVTALDALVVGASLAAMPGLHLMLQRTRRGTALRAMASNFALARARGVPTGATIMLMWFLTGAFAALGGILVALQTQLTPNMDPTILLPVCAAVAIGGMGNVFGAAVGAFLLSPVRNVLVSVRFGGLTGGPPRFLPTQVKDLVAMLALEVGLAPGQLAGAVRVSERIIHSLLGRMPNVLREDETLAATLGRDPFRHQAAVVGGAWVMAGAAGALHAQVAGYVHEFPLLVIETFVIWTAMILGGAGRTVGVIVGAVVLQAPGTSTRFVARWTELPSDLVANLRLALVGALPVAMILHRPAGLFPERRRRHDTRD